MKMQFTTGWRWVAVWVAGMAIMGLAGCGGGSDGGGGSGGGGAYQGSYDGGFNGTDEGAMAFTIDGNGIISGTAHSMLDNLDYVISGDVNEAGELSAGAYVGGNYLGTYQGTIDAGGAVRGTWGSEDGSGRGTFAAQLN